MSLRSLAFSLSLVFVLMPPNTSLEAQSSKNPDFSEVRETILRQMESSDVPSVSVAVAQNGNIIWEEGFGWADRENEVPTNKHTMYSLASVTKLFTSTALMILKERGVLDVDNPVNDYLGPAKVTSHAWNTEGATVQRIANHTAGLGTHFWNQFSDEPHNEYLLDDTINKYGVLIWQPGERFDYSNLGYGILGEVIARVSGKSYSEFINGEVLSPLGLSRTSVGIDSKLAAFIAAQYVPNFGRVEGYTNSTPGASIIYGSVHDLVSFGLFHLNSNLLDQTPVLSDTSIDQMQSSTAFVSEDFQYSYGWWIEEDYFGQKRFFVSGGRKGASAVLVLIPSEKIVVAVLANANASFPHQIPAEILSVLIPAFKERRIQESNFSPVLGTWQGLIRTGADQLSLELTVFASGEISAKLGEQGPVRFEDAKFEDGKLTGRMTGDAGTEDANRQPRPYKLAFELILRDNNVLNGAVTTNPTSGPGGAAGLSYWVNLKRY